MFSKDPFTMGYAQASLRSLAFIEPRLIMPDLLERAYNGLEVVNETHRTTAVLTMLAGVAHPLVSEKAWLGGQKHVVPLLELCIPGIDLVRASVSRMKLSDDVLEERPHQDNLYLHVCLFGRTVYPDWGRLHAFVRRSPYR